MVPDLVNLKNMQIKIQTLRKMFKLLWILIQHIRASNFDIQLTAIFLFFLLMIIHHFKTLPFITKSYSLVGGERHFSGQVLGDAATEDKLCKCSGLLLR